MARNGISYDDVKQMIDEMLAEGLNPTIAGLRERLGSGSFTTISEHLKRWRTERQKQPMLTEGSPAPDNLSSMVQAVWRQAREDAVKDLERYKQEIQQTLDLAQTEKQQALDQAAATEEKNIWLDARNNDLLQMVRQLEKEASLSAAKVEQLKEDKQALELKIRQMNEALNTSKQEWHREKQEMQSTATTQQNEFSRQLQQLTGDHKQALVIFEQQLREERQRSEASDQHWMAQLDHLRRQLKEREQQSLQQEKNYQQQLSMQLKTQSETGKILQTIGERQTEQQHETRCHGEQLNRQQQLLISMIDQQSEQQQSLHKISQINNQTATEVQQLAVALDVLKESLKKQNEGDQ